MYPGGKGNVYQRIINWMPPHRVYIEPFLGRGYVMENKRPARVNIGVELDRAVLLATAEELLPGSIARVDGAGHLFDDTAGNSDGRRRASSEMTGVARANAGVAPAGRIRNTPPDVAIGAAIAGRDGGGREWHFLNMDALAFLRAYPFVGNELVYVDPPYLFRTRRTGDRGLYDCEFGTESEHRRLLEVLLALPCRVILSGYKSALYDEMLTGWNTDVYPAQTRGGSTAEEWLWMNFPEPAELHDYRYLGDDYRERERIKRKASRWVRRFSNLPRLERMAIVSRLRDESLLQPRQE